MWTDASRARAAWRRLENVLRSAEFMDAVVTGVGIDGLRVQDLLMSVNLNTHKEGFGIGMHSDSAQKLVTGMFYFPHKDRLDEQIFTHGTNIHSIQDWKNRNDNTGMPRDGSFGERFPFLPNSMFVLKIGQHSFHSVSVLPEGGPSRNVINFNIFEKHNTQGFPNLMPARRRPSLESFGTQAKQQRGRSWQSE